MKKKISNYILFPLILGGTSIVCAGALAGVNYAVAGIIEGNKTSNITKKIGSFFKGNKGYEIIYDSSDASVKDEHPITETPAEFDSHILRCYRVTTSDDKLGLVYHAKTDTGYSGNLELVIGVFESSVIGVASVGGSEDTLGVNAMNTLAGYLSWENKFSSGDDMNDFALNAGASAKATFPVVQSLMEIVLADEVNRIAIDTSGKISAEVDVKVLENNANSIKFELTSVSKTNYVSMKANVTMSINTLTLKNAKVTVEMVEYDGGENGGEGTKVIEGTAEDDFTKKYIGKELALNTFRRAVDHSSVAPDFENSVAKNTAQGYYLMMNGLYNYLNTASNISQFCYVGKISDTEYRSRYVTNDGFASIDLKATVDQTSKYFTKIEILTHSGTEGYGKDMLEGQKPGANTIADKVNEFIENYIKITGEGLPIEKFSESRVVTDDILHNGASYTSFGYYTALHQIAELLGGNN